MSAKMATPDPLKIGVFWNKGYDVIIFVHDVTITFFSRDWNYIIDMVIRTRFGYCSISMRKVIKLNFKRIWPEKLLFLRSGLGSSLGLPLVTTLKFYTSVAKLLKFKVRKFWELNPTFVEVTGEKLVGDLFCPHILDRVNSLSVLSKNLNWLWSKFIFLSSFNSSSLS